MDEYYDSNYTQDEKLQGVGAWADDDLSGNWENFAEEMNEELERMIWVLWGRLMFSDLLSY